MPQEFRDHHPRDAHGAYIQWIGNSPRGYVLNRKTLSFGRLHQLPCSHIANYDDPNVSLTRKMKVCDTSRAAVEKWAEDRGVEWTDCPDCLG